MAPSPNSTVGSWPIPDTCTYWNSAGKIVNIIPATSAPRYPRTPTVTTTASHTRPIEQREVGDADRTLLDADERTTEAGDGRADGEDANPRALDVDPDALALDRVAPHRRARCARSGPASPTSSSDGDDGEHDDAEQDRALRAAQAEDLELRVDHARERHERLHVEDELLAEQGEGQGDEREPDLVEAGAHQADDDAADHRRGDADDDGEQRAARWPPWPGDRRRTRRPRRSRPARGRGCRPRRSTR